MHVALQDGPRAFVARIPNGEIGIVARRDAALPPVETIQLGWVRRRQLHEARKAEAGFVCWLAGWRLVEEQWHSRLEAGKTVGDFGEAWDRAVHQAELFAAWVVVFAWRVVGGEGCERSVGD